MTQQTPSEAAYIAAQETYTSAQVLQITMLSVFVVGFLALGAIHLWMWRRELRAKCGTHKFEARSDQSFDTETQKWRTTYVRDVCINCGEARERTTEQP